MELLIYLNEENSKRLISLRAMGMVDINTDNICNDAIKDQLDKAEDILSDFVDHFQSR